MPYPEEYSSLENTLLSDPLLLQSILDSVPFGVAVADHSGNLIFINAFLLNFLGYEKEELFGQSILSIIPIEYQKRTLDNFDSVLTSKESYSAKNIFQNKDGVFLESFFCASFLNGPLGQPWVLASFLDFSGFDERELSHKRLGRVLEHSSNEFYLFSSQNFQFIQISQGALNNLGYTFDELQNKTPLALTPRISAKYFEEIIAPLKSGQTEVVRFETLHKRKNNSYYDVEIRLQLIKNEHPELFLATIRDISRQKKKDMKMEILTQVIEQGNDWVLITDKEGKILYANEAVEKMSGHSKEEFIGKKPFIWKSGQHTTAFYKELWDTILAGKPYRNILINRRKDGQLFYLDSNIIPIFNHNKDVTYFVTTAKDITADKFMEERLTYLAYYDSLTSLPNRTFFTEQINLEIKRISELKEIMAILNLDISRFVYINETYGNDLGDAVLKQVALQLSNFSKGEEMLARISGDNFGIILTGFADTNEIAAIVDRMIKSLTRPMMILGQELVLSINVGVSVFPEDGSDAEQLISKSEMALNKASKKGRNVLQFFTNDMNRSASDFLLKEKNIYKAKDNDEFFVYYQPYYDILSEEMRGMESLMRWNSPKLGLISPADFIPLLEETGLIIEIGQKIIQQVCSQMAAWLKQGKNVVPVAINLSPIQFRKNDLVDFIIKTVQDFSLDPRLIVLEVTESTFMDDLDYTQKMLWKIKDNGFTISIDDFGTGYSSLAYLKKFPVDNLKIDQSFIRGIHQDEDGASIVNAIISMARNLHLKTIAEGIETREELEILRVLECDIGQGYYWSRPVAADQVPWINEKIEIADAEEEL